MILLQAIAFFAAQTGGASTSSMADALVEPEVAVTSSAAYHVHVRAKRLSEPARVDTALRITGEELAERGVTNLAQALELVPDTTVRPQGRGGYQVNIRGARKGSVMILVDGVPLSDVYNGNFDLTSIPATDVAEIRVSLTPASPLDGPGGNGGVIEVRTRAATGDRELRGDFQSSDAPSGYGAITMRGGLPGEVYARLSGGGNVANRELPAVLPDNSRSSIAEDSRMLIGGLRLERKLGKGRASLDLAATRRRFIVPPAEAETAEVLRVDQEDLFRAFAGYNTRLGSLSISANAYGMMLDRDARRFRDATMTEVRAAETLFAYRAGANAQADLLATEDLRLTFVTHVTHEYAKNALQTMRYQEAAGSISVVEPAAGAAWEITDWLGFDAAVGLAIPFGADADPWPEAKAWFTFHPDLPLEIRLTGASKGRVPVLRERYEIGTGNPEIDPETGTSAELSIESEPLEFVRFTGSAFYRLTGGLIRLNDDRTLLTNVGDVYVQGFEARADLFRDEVISGGLAYAYADAGSEELGDDPLDFFPGHRADAWINARYERHGGTWLRLRYTGTRPDNGETLDPYVTLDAAVFATYESLTMTVRAENLFDQGYDLRSNVPGFGRTLYLSIGGVID